MRKFICILLSFVLLFSLTLIGCGEKTFNFNFNIITENSNIPDINIDLSDIAKRFYGEDYAKDQEVYEKFKAYAKGLSNHLDYSNNVSTAYPDEEYGFQMNEPKDNEEIAIMHTNMGDIYIRFFPEAAPKAVENFKTHAKNGYYNGLSFFRVVNDAYIQSGDPNGDGTGGESIWGKPFEDEFDSKLLNLRGSLIMANRGVNSNESQFIINQNKPSLTDDSKAIYDIVQIYKSYIEAYEYNIEVYNSFGRNYLELYPTFEHFIEDNTVGFSPISYLVPDEVWKLYDEKGGNIHLDGAWRAEGGHTVFAQVFKGMDVVDVIAKTGVNGESKPEIDILINSIEFVKYTAK